MVMLIMQEDKIELEKILSLKKGSKTGGKRNKKQMIQQHNKQKADKFRLSHLNNSIKYK